jgi:hypothetical protein
VDGHCETNGCCKGVNELHQPAPTVDGGTVAQGIVSNRIAAEPEDVHTSKSRGSRYAEAIRVLRCDTLLTFHA